MSAALATTVEDALRLLHEPGEVFEVRIFGVKGAGTVSGYFDDPTLAAAAIAGYDDAAEGIYHTINPVDPALLERASNRLREKVGKGQATSDNDIIRRRWLPVDVDFTRPAKTNATEEELKAAGAAGKRIRARLENELGYPAAVKVMSGNGVHLLHRIDLPADAASRDLVKRILEKLDKDFSVEGGAHVDTSVHNAARIMKVPGTMVRKGPNSKERPHRRSSLLDPPDNAVCVLQNALEAFAPREQRVPLLTPSQQSVAGNGKTPWTVRDVESHLAAWGQEIRNHRVEDSADWWELKVCPYNPEHDRGEAYVTRDAAGRLLAGCHHNSCTWHWEDLRAKFDPEHAARSGVTPGLAVDLVTGEVFPERAPHDCSDDGNAFRLIKMHGDKIRYLPGEEKWLIWDGRRWKRDDAHEIENLTAEALRAIHHEAAEATTEKQTNELARWAITSGSAQRRGGALTCARSEPAVVVRREDLDSDPYLLNIMNGTLDLRTGKLRPHRQEDALTWLAPVEFHGLDVRDVVFERVLDDATNSDPEFQCWLQRYAGMSLVGEMTELVLILLGGTETGKSTLTSALTATLGEGNYALTGNQEALLKSSNTGGPRGSVMAFEGRRLVTIPEFDPTKTLDEPLLKTLTGERTFQGRELYKNDHAMKPISKLWLHTNHMPKVTVDDASLWRRLRVAPFICRPERIDETIKPYLSDPEQAGPAVLAWAVRGCLDWQAAGGGKDGLGPCAIVDGATAQLRMRMDPLADFFEECCVFELDAFTPSSDIRRRYVLWADDNNVPKNQRQGDRVRATGLRLRGASDEGPDGYRKDAGKLTRGWTNVRLDGLGPLLRGAS